MTGRDGWSLATRLIHEGERTTHDGVQPTSLPIYTSSTYLHPSAELLNQAFENGGLVYGRYGNPTVAGFEAAVALLEGGVGAVAFASGMAALHIALLAAGTSRGAMQPDWQRAICSIDVYGATRVLLNDFFRAQGLQTDFVDMTDLRAVEAAFAAAPPDVVVLEPISNPVLRVVDVGAIAKLCQTVGARLVVDNTIPTPLMMRPLLLGADFAIHSATKYLGGHGDVIGGIVAMRKTLPLDTVRRYAHLLGSGLGPFDARLLSRGVKTLGLRFKQQCMNANIVAHWLQDQPEVAHVYFPGLPSHPQHELTMAQFNGCGGAMVAFDLRHAERAAAYRFMDALQLILPGTSLGDIYSLITYPALSSHRELTQQERATQGIGEGLLRLSIGIEDADDIIADLRQALSAV